LEIARMVLPLIWVFRKVGPLVDRNNAIFELALSAGRGLKLKGAISSGK
jgi:hypothetical protein